MIEDSERIREAKLILFCRWVAEETLKAMRDPEFMKGFYEWHLKTYGEPYKPKTQEVSHEPTEEPSETDIV